jgi:hypothetical protein
VVGRRYTPLEYLRYRYAPTVRLRANSVRRGLLGGNRGWLAVFIAIQVIDVLRRAASKSPERISVDALKPGEGLVIRTIPVRDGRERERVLRGG